MDYVIQPAGQEMALGKPVIRLCMKKMSYRSFRRLACFVECRNKAMSRAFDGHTMVNYVRCGNGGVGCNAAKNVVTATSEVEWAERVEGRNRWEVLLFY